MAYKINKDVYVGDTGKQLKDILTNANNIATNTTNINKLKINDFSNTSNGWIKLPNGLILQWKSQTFTFTGRTDSTITFPKAFTNCFMVLGEINDSGYGGSTPHTSLDVVSYNNTKADITFKTTFTSQQSVNVRIFAIGN